MSEPSAEPLAPNTPERLSGSQSSTIEAGDDMVILESSPTHPGSSKAARVTQSASNNNSNIKSVSRLSSFYYRDPKRTPLTSSPSQSQSSASVLADPPLSHSPIRINSSSSTPSPVKHLSSTNSKPPVAVKSPLKDNNSAPANSISIGSKRGIAPADFGQIISQFKWTDDDSNQAIDALADSIISTHSKPTRKRVAANISSSPENKKRARSSMRSSIVDLSDSENDGQLATATQPEGNGQQPRKRRLQRGSRSQSNNKLSPSPQELFPPAPPAKPAGRSLVRGRKQRRSGGFESLAISDSDDEGDTDNDSEPDDFKLQFSEIEPHIMELFNKGTADELMQKAGATPEEVKILEGMRPFSDMNEIEYSLRKTKGIRLSIYSQYRDTILGHAEVEGVIHQCSGIFKRLRDTMTKAGVQIDEEAVTETGGAAVKISEHVHLEQPKMINDEYSLKHYQLEGVEWLSCLHKANASGILADEMGLGKTFQVIAFICKGIEEGNFNKPSLVVCPSSTLENWVNECRRFAPGLRVVSYYGSQAERLRMQSHYDDETSYDVMITTYNIATGNKLDRVFLKKRKFQAMILDEGHMVKNCMSSRYKWLAQIRTPFRLLLTGTPLQNNLQELVSLLTFILPQVFSDAQPALSHAFKSRSATSSTVKRVAPVVGTDSEDTATNTPGERTGYSSVAASSGTQTPIMINQKELGPVESQHIEQAKKLLRPFVLRRCKADVLGDLPSKTEYVVRVELTEEQRKVYDDIAQTAQGDGEQEGGEDAIRATLMQLDSLDNSSSSGNGKKNSASKSNSSSGKAQQQQQSSWISTFMDMRKTSDHPLLLRSRYKQEKLVKMAKALMREPDYADANYEYVLEDMQVCSDFELHRICKQYPKLRQFMLDEAVVENSGKILELKKILGEAVKNKEKTLVFSQFTTMIDILEAVLKHWSIDYCRLDGATKVDERQTMIDEFNGNPDKCPVFLLSTKAGGFGINLTSANVVVIYDMGNNPSEERQAEDRAHRVGQTKDVRVYKLIGSNTIDEDILECSKAKLLMEQCFWLKGLPSSK